MVYGQSHKLGGLHMLQIIGLIVAVYACARLLQVPCEHVSERNRFVATLVLGLIGVAVIGLLTVGLLRSGVDTSRLPGLGR
jgi:hypothetical protein